MHSRATFPPLPVAFVAGLLFLAEALPAQVTEWRFFKSAVYEQFDTSAPTTPFSWDAGALVITSSPGDAALITISGGSIAGSLSLQHEGGGVWILEREYATQAAMNAEFPSNSTYTLVLSGGTLGTLTQSVVVGPERYPNIPYLTIASLNTAWQFPSTTATTLTWSNPGPLTQALGLTVLDIADRNWSSIYSSATPGAVTAQTVPANTLAANDCHWGWLEFTHDTLTPAGGFGVAGTSHHTRGTDFQIRTWPYPTPPCAWHETYGSGCANLEIHSNDPILGTSWNMTTTGIAPAAFGFVYFSLAPQDPPLPLSAFGINAPGCSGYIDTFSIVATVGGFATSGQLGVSIPVPSAPSFGGLVFYVQTVALSPLLPAGVGTSNLIEAMVGS